VRTERLLIAHSFADSRLRGATTIAGRSVGQEVEMGILLGLAPFIAFFALMRLVSPLAGLAAGLVASLLLGVRMWWRGETIKILEIGSLILFAGLTLYTLVAAPAWSVASVRLVVDAGLLAIVLVSLASAARLHCRTPASGCRKNSGRRRVSCTPTA
jgi:hypothetical protein